MIDMGGIRTVCMAVLVGFVGLAVAGWAPSPAAANPLLSGYGGPGQGSQAILGSTIIGGGPGSAGGSSAAGGSARSSQASGTFGGGEPRLSAGSGASGGASERSESAGGGSGASTGAVGTGAQTGHRGRASGSVAGAYPSVSAERAYLAVAAGSGRLSAVRLWYVLPALVALACVAFLTRRLVLTNQQGHEGHQSLKGRVVGPE